MKYHINKKKLDQINQIDNSDEAKNFVNSAPDMIASEKSSASKAAPESKPKDSKSIAESNTKKHRTK